MFCDDCGAVVESDSKFCDSCGKELKLSVSGGQPVIPLGQTEHLGRRWGKPLLIIALLAVAATAAVIAYEKVGGSATRHPDFSTAQGVTNAVGGALNLDTLTRSEAQALLDRKIPTPTPDEAGITLNVPYSQINYDYPPETPGALRIKQFAGIWDSPFERVEREVIDQAVRASLIIQERGELPDNVIMGMHMPPNLRPSYTNRLTEKGQRFMPGGRIVIPVTRTIEVTGISMDQGGKTATVTYSVTYNAVPFAGDVALTNLILDGYGSARPAWGVPQPKEADFQKFDDGWRVR